MSTDHHVTVRAGGRSIENWNSYDVACDMLEAADGFSLTLGPADPVSRSVGARTAALLGAGGESAHEAGFGHVWDLVRPDAPVEILLDDIVIMSGYIDERTGNSSRDGDTISVNGRDKCGRLLDESMPLISFKGLTLEALALRVGSPWITKVVFSNAANRALLIGKGRGAKGGRVFREPDVEREPRVYRKVEPGETRWSVLQYFMHESDLLAWGAADGRTLVIGQPNYDQEPTFAFFHARAGSARAALANCATFSVKDSVADRYSQIVTMGANAGSAREYAESTVKRKGVAVDGPGLYGIGNDFQFRKVLLLPDDAIKNDKQAQIRAAREMAERDANGHELTLTVWGHSQTLEGSRAPSLFACDTMAYVESEVFGIRGAYLITSVQFKRSREDCTTTIKLVPKGTLLRA